MASTAPASVSSTSPPSTFSTGSGAGRGGRAPSMRRMTRRSSSRVGTGPSDGEHGQDRGRGRFGPSPHLVDGPDARGTSPRTRTRPERVAGVLHEIVKYLEETLREPD